MLTILLISIAVANVSNASNISHQNIIVEHRKTGCVHTKRDITLLCKCYCRDILLAFAVRYIGNTVCLNTLMIVF